MLGVLLVMLLVFKGGQASSGCNYTNQVCGDLTIPYPFGMIQGCGLPDYIISCREEVAFLQLPDNTNEFQVLQFNTSSLLINATDIRASTNCALTSVPAMASISIPSDLPFAISNSNVFASIGCDFIGTFYADVSTSSCQTPCFTCSPQDCPATYSFCSAYSCCTVPLYSFYGKSITITGQETSPSPLFCGFSAVLSPESYIPTISMSLIDGYLISSPVGQYALQLTWGLPLISNTSTSCSIVNETSSYACSPVAECVDVASIPGYVCVCNRSGYEGDGYLIGTGCQSICVNSNCVGPPNGTCTVKGETYTCSCNDGYQGDGTIDGSRCIKINSHEDFPVTSTVIAFATVITLTGLSLWLVYRLGMSKIRKAKYFEKNGGMRLKQHISATRGRETPSLYSEAELKRATQSFAKHLQLGRGGYGTVYKGVLADGKVVAIKKANRTEQHEADQFINEVIILSQINHRNIVHLVGCCLETPVPLLVYEYVSNGTLFEHLHAIDGRFLSWETRLVIALESAQAVAYLHSCASTPIFHRDIKSSNILLDTALTPKVSDFGLSRLLPMDQTHISTIVQGTMGYLDPEYFQTYQLTDKSDVYSFGIVLLELITSLKPVAMERGVAESNLATLCISRWITGTFPTLIDPGLRASQNPEMMRSINQVAKLAIDCLHVEGQKRPTMKEVHEVLLWIGGSGGALVQAYIHSSHDPHEEDIQTLIPSSHQHSEEASSSDQTSLPSLNRSRPLEIEMAMMESFHMEGGR